MNKEETGLPYHLTGFVQRDIDLIVRRVSNERTKRDAVVIYTGSEGTGKTTLAIQHAYAITKQQGRTFNLQQIYFNPEKLIEDVQESKWPPGTPLIYDEAVTGLLGKMGSYKMGVKLQILFNTCRSKRYPILLCIPRFYEMPQWLVTDRSLAMYRTYTKPRGKPEDENYDPGIPGYYVGYPMKSKSQYYYYIKSKKYNMIPQVVTTLEGSFSQWPFGINSKDIPFTEEQYETAKANGLKEQIEPSKRNEIMSIGQRNRLVNFVISEKMLTLKEVAAILGSTVNAVKEYSYKDLQDHVSLQEIRARLGRGGKN